MPIGVDNNGKTFTEYKSNMIVYNLGTTMNWYSEHVQHLKKRDAIRNYKRNKNNPRVTDEILQWKSYSIID